MTTELRDLDATAVLHASAGAARDRRLAEVRDLETLGQWAALHSSDPTQGPDGAIQRRIGNVLQQVGGEGTPWVQAFCLAEIAMARGTGETSATNALADYLDLVHRMPLTWEKCRTGEVEIYAARRAARVSRHLPADKMWVVDQAVARVIDTGPPGHAITVAEAKVIEADPELHDRRVAEEKARRFFATSRTDEAGLKMIYARVEAGDAAAAEAVVTRVAQIISPEHPRKSYDEIRALAFGIVLRPAECLQLLLEHAIAAQTATEADPVAEAAPPAEEPEEPEEPHLPRAFAFPADLLDALRSIDLTALRPTSTLYVHLHESALHGSDAVARVEGLGPVSLTQLHALLGHRQVTVKPVIDLAERIRTTAYEHSESLKERIHLITGGDYWPYATSTSRKVDHDHPTPFDHAAAAEPDPPKQTGSHNSGPLTRRHHVWKTHGGYRAGQSGQGRYVITTPHGLAFLRDHRGTRRIDAHQARIMLEAGPNVDVYFPDEVDCVEVALPPQPWRRRTRPPGPD